MSGRGSAWAASWPPGPRCLQFCEAAVLAVTRGVQLGAVWVQLGRRSRRTGGCRQVELSALHPAPPRRVCLPGDAACAPAVVPPTPRATGALVVGSEGGSLVRVTVRPPASNGGSGEPPLACPAGRPPAGLRRPPRFCMRCGWRRRTGAPPCPPASSAGRPDLLLAPAAAGGRFRVRIIEVAPAGGAAARGPYALEGSGLGPGVVGFQEGQNVPAAGLCGGIWEGAVQARWGGGAARRGAGAGAVRGRACRCCAPSPLRARLPAA